MASAGLLPYQNCMERFLVSSVKLETQYDSMYNLRLSSMAAAAVASSSTRWGESEFQRLHQESIVDCKESTECILIGILYKDNKSKSKIASLLEKVEHPDRHPGVCVTPDDVLFIEDSSGRLQLLGDSLATNEVVSGLIVAVRGTMSRSIFTVVEHCFPSFRASALESIPRPPESDHFVIFLSGLSLSESPEVLLPLELLIGFLSGQLSDVIPSPLDRIFVCGNSVADPSIRFSRNRQGETESHLQVLQRLDTLLVHLCTFAHVDLLPGITDYTNAFIPQQPMHPLLFPQASRLSTFHPVSNPYECLLGYTRILGSTGDLTDDILSNTTLPSPIAALERSLAWRHLVPSCPDTLCSYPFYDDEPFIIDDVPDIYFTANQSQMEWKLVARPGAEAQRTLLLAVPCFHKTFEVVLVNLRTLEPQSVKFSVQQPTL